jgi:Holliday junction resolvasome RuvABC ATP-dependent DNA helicase subunit
MFSNMISNTNERQTGREILKSCKICGTTLLKYVDFSDSSRNTEVCCNCLKLDPTSKEVVNASPYLFSGQYKSKEVQQQEDNSIITFYDSNGKPLNKELNLLYNVDYQQKELANKSNEIEIKDKLILQQSNPNPIEAINKVVKPVLNANVTQTGKIIIDWSRVIGYEDIKELMSRAINIPLSAKKRVHVLLVGAPGTSKTVFLQTIQDSLQKQAIEGVHYLDATTLTSSGVIDYLFSNDNLRFVLIDELDKCSKEHQSTFLNLFETGILQETKGSIAKINKKIRRKEIKQCTFICTANYEDKILNPLKTRMTTLRIKEYTKEQFYQIGEELLTKQYGRTHEIAKYIINEVWHIYKEIRKESPNLRYCRDIAILMDKDNTIEAAKPIIKAISEHSISYQE